MPNNAMIHNLLRLLILTLGLGIVLYLAFFKHGPSGSDGIPQAEAESEAEQTTPRLLAAQIVDTEPQDVFVERAVIEGKPFKAFLKRAASMGFAQIRDTTDEKLLFENLGDEPDKHRGAAYTPGRGVVVEISRAELTPEYGFPPGWTVLPAVFVNSAKEVYALRFICAPNSTLYDKLKKGINDDNLPVINLAGLFFKNYARRTGDPKQPPWVRALLVCPEPEFPADAEPRHVLKDLDEAGYGRLLPSQRIDAPGAEGRLVIDAALTKGAFDLQMWGKNSGADLNALASAVEKLKQRLPADQAANPSAVVLVRGAPLPDPRVQKIEDALKALGVKRVFIKQDVVQNISGK